MPRADAIAAQIRDAFDDYHARFAAISRRAQKRFETRDWAAAMVWIRKALEVDPDDAALRRLRVKVWLLRAWRRVADRASR